jgi:hypothetical protein
MADAAEYASGSASIQDQLHDLSTFTFPRPPDPDDDPTGRTAFRAVCERIDPGTRQAFLRFPCASVLERLEAVETVSFRHCGLGDKGTVALCEALRVNQAVTALDLSDNGITHTGLVALLGALTKSVRTLDLAGNRVTKGGALLLAAELSALREAAIAAIGVPGSPQQQSLASPHAAMGNTSRGASVAPQQQPPLTGAPTAGGAKQQQQHAAATAAGGGGQLAMGATLRGSVFGASMTSATAPVTLSAAASAGASAGFALGQFLGRNSSLQHLSLRGNRLTDTDIIAMSEGLAENAGLSSLDLSHNEIGPGAGPALAVVLLRSPLTELNLEWNKLQNAGGSAIIRDGLAISDVKRVFLAWNGLGDEAAEQLGKILATSSTVEEIDVSNNNIGPKGAEWIAKGLRITTTLFVLTVHDNPLRDDGCLALLKGVLDNHSLTTVDMRATGAGTASAAMLPTILTAKPASFHLDMPRTAATVDADVFE